MSSNNLIIAPRKISNSELVRERKTSTLIADMKSLVKGLVLVSNALPVYNPFILHDGCCYICIVLSLEHSKDFSAKF